MGPLFDSASGTFTTPNDRKLLSSGRNTTGPEKAIVLSALRTVMCGA